MYFFALDQWLCTLSRRCILALGSLQIVLVECADVFAPQGLQLSLFHVLPIIMLTWYVSRLAGLVFGALATALLTFTDWHLGLLTNREALLLQAGAHALLFLIVILILDVVIVKFDTVQQQADQDPLTGALNKGAFGRMLRHHLRLARRAGWPVTLAYVDLDRFKALNDTCGHSEGDRALKQVATTMRQTLRESDIVGRVGGDEFAIVLMNTRPDDVVNLMEAIRTALRDRFSSWPVPVTCSIGAVTFVDPPLDEKAALSAADNLMYQAKQSGRDQNFLQLVHPALHHYRDKALRAFADETRARAVSLMDLSQQRES